MWNDLVSSLEPDIWSGGFFSKVSASMAWYFSWLYRFKSSQSQPNVKAIFQAPPISRFIIIGKGCHRDLKEILKKLAQPCTCIIHDVYHQMDLKGSSSLVERLPWSLIVSSLSSWTIRIGSARMRWSAATMTPGASAWHLAPRRARTQGGMTFTLNNIAIHSPSSKINPSSLCPSHFWVIMMIINPTYTLSSYCLCHHV